MAWLSDGESPGRRSSPLDEIGPARWNFSTELLNLISILQHTVEVTRGLLNCSSLS